MANSDLYSVISNTPIHEDEIVNPYNEYNKLITAKDIKKLFAKFNIDIEPININEYITALTHKSYIKKEYYDLHQIHQYKLPNIIDLLDKSNEILEFFGDTVIKSIIAGYLYIRYPYCDEGFMTTLKANIEDRDSLAIFAKKLGLDEFMIISKQIEQKDGRNSKKLLEDCFEAFMGALMLDVGYEICKNFLYILLETEVDYSDLLYKDKNYKGRLNVFYNEMSWPKIQYVPLGVETINNSKLFIMGVVGANGDVIAQGKAKSKKEAEKIASMMALYKFNVITEDQMILPNSTDKNDIND